MGLNRLTAPRGARITKRKRVGRGDGSGHGGTSGRGHKGQHARSGCQVAPGFEGGQMPLQRRLPKRGFKNHCRVDYQPVNLRDLSSFEDHALVDPASLKARGLINRGNALVKILSVGELKKPLTVRAHAFSEAAKQKIEAAGGSAELIVHTGHVMKSAPSKEG